MSSTDSQRFKSCVESTGQRPAALNRTACTGFGWLATNNLVSYLVSGEALMQGSLIGVPLAIGMLFGILTQKDVKGW